MLDRFDGYWGGEGAVGTVVRKEIAERRRRASRSCKAGQLDLIVRAPASDVPTLEKDAKLSVVKVDTVYVFNIELDMREKPPQVCAKDGSAAA